MKAWISCSIKPEEVGTYPAKIRGGSPNAKKIKLTWDGKFWIMEDGSQFPSHRIDFYKYLHPKGKTFQVSHIKALTEYHEKKREARAVRYKGLPSRDNWADKYA